ncbi:hypothetical protein [Alkalihalobacterium chitinilyticum]|uniref:Permease n=1 Tax=Alkalihalobacterium chitinilyticum TaxID=2980103 RepID=A0ABT5VMZ2_9BACI|nr:hypothetical protein [Alkalihalobacterium chitinilyticum]MDE5416142.1 hypothetical protein [Alkalihalobacterium chitinilyticum]
MTITNNVKKNQITYYFLGILLTGLGIYLNFNYIINGVFPVSIIIFAIGIAQLMYAYLFPHLFPKDERAKSIIGKAMTVNYFILFGAILILYLLTSSFGPLTLNASQVLELLFSIMIIAIPGTMVIYSKIT